MRRPKDGGVGIVRFNYVVNGEDYAVDPFPTEESATLEEFLKYFLTEKGKTNK